MTEVNLFLWVAANILGALTFFAAAIFSVAYPLIFRMGETSAGPRFWRAILSIAGLGLLAFLGTFIDGRVPFSEMPADIAWWRPVIRFVVTAWVAWSFTDLVVLLVQRRFFPHKIRIAPEDSLGMVPRKPHRRPRS